MGNKGKVTKDEIKQLCQARIELIKIKNQHGAGGGSETLLQKFSINEAEFNKKIADITTSWLGIQR